MARVEQVFVKFASLGTFGTVGGRLLTFPGAIDAVAAVQNAEEIGLGKNELPVGKGGKEIVVWVVAFPSDADSCARRMASFRARDVLDTFLERHKP
jgi:hypothetical protein